MAPQPPLDGLRPIHVIRAFQRLGYVVERVGGGHFILEHPGRPPFQVPYRAVEAMAPGFIGSQLRVAGFTRADFRAALIETARERGDGETGGEGDGALPSPPPVAQSPRPPVPSPPPVSPPPTGPVSREVLLHPTAGGDYWSEVPSLSGCGSQGRTVDETVANTRNAIEGWVTYLRDNDRPIPAHGASRPSGREEGAGDTSTGRNLVVTIKV